MPLFVMNPLIKLLSGRVAKGEDIDENDKFIFLETSFIPEIEVFDVETL